MRRTTRNERCFILGTAVERARRGEVGEVLDLLRLLAPAIEKEAKIHLSNELRKFLIEEAKEEGVRYP